jgi:hypothetical protein
MKACQPHQTPLFTQLITTEKSDAIPSGAWFLSVFQWNYHFDSMEPSLPFNDQHLLNGA